MIELGTEHNDIASLKKMDWAKLNEAGNAAVAKINPPMKPGMGPLAAQAHAARRLWAHPRWPHHHRALFQ